MTGPRIVANVDTERPPKPSQLPLPGNDDHRGSEGILARAMSYVAVSFYTCVRLVVAIDHSQKQGKGINPDPHVPEKPLNKQQPAPQRINAAGTHHYTKVRRIHYRVLSLC